MNDLFSLADALIARARATGLAVRLMDTSEIYVVAVIDGVEVILERSPKTFVLAAYDPETLDNTQIASGSPPKVLEVALEAIRGFQDKLAGV